MTWTFTKRQWEKREKKESYWTYCNSKNWFMGWRISKPQKISLAGRNGIEAIRSDGFAMYSVRSKRDIHNATVQERLHKENGGLKAWLLWLPRTTVVLYLVMVVKILALPFPSLPFSAKSNWVASKQNPGRQLSTEYEQPRVLFFLFIFSYTAQI